MNQMFTPSFDLVAAREFLTRHKEAIKGMNAVQAKDKLRELDKGIDIMDEALDRAVAEHYGILPTVEVGGYGIQIHFVRG